MKRFLSYFLAIAAIVALGVSCTPDEETATATPELKLTQALVNVSNEAGSVVLTYTINNAASNGILTASLASSASWITKVDYSNDGSIVIYYDANTSHSSRQATLNVTYEYGSNSIVKQAMINQTGSSEYNFSNSLGDTYCYVMYYGYQFSYYAYYPLYEVYLFSDSTPQYYYCLDFYSVFPDNDFDYENSVLPAGSYFCGTDEYLTTDGTYYYGTIGVTYGYSAFAEYEDSSADADVNYSSTIADGYLTVTYDDDYNMYIVGTLTDDQGCTHNIDFSGVVANTSAKTVYWFNANYYTYGISSAVNVDLSDAYVVANYYKLYEDNTRDWVIYLEDDVHGYTYKIALNTDDDICPVSEGLPTGVFTGEPVAYDHNFYTGFVGYVSSYSSWGYYYSWFFVTEGSSTTGVATLNSNAVIEITKNDDGTYTIDVDAYAYEVDASSYTESFYDISGSWTGSDITYYDASSSTSGVQQSSVQTKSLMQSENPMFKADGAGSLNSNDIVITVKRAAKRIVR